MAKHVRVPGRAFVSHSYDDNEAIGDLRRLFRRRRSTDLVMFPPIEGSPGALVSDDIIPTIESCDSLIYVKSDASNSSVWVRFEREFAIRAGKPVFVFDPRRKTIEKDTPVSQKLRILPIYRDVDEWTVFRIIKFMQRERYLGEIFDDKSRVERPFLEEMWKDWAKKKHGCILIFAGANRTVEVPPFLEITRPARAPKKRPTKKHGAKSQTSWPWWLSEALVFKRTLVACLDEAGTRPPGLADWQYVGLARKGTKHVTASRATRTKALSTNTRILGMIYPRRTPYLVTLALSAPNQNRGAMSSQPTRAPGRCHRALIFAGSTIS